MGIKPAIAFKVLWSTLRGWNLLMILLIMLLVRHTVVLPLLNYEGLSSSLSDNRYLLLMLATVLIAAGGNLINDIFDTRADSINKPGQNPVGSLITKTSANILYFILTGAGLISGWFAAKGLSENSFYYIFPLCAGLLFFYSYSYKNIPLLGNLIIALLASASVMITILFDTTAFHPGGVSTLVAGYAVFAFLMTLAREIIKDCQDINGDNTVNSRTLPVVSGVTFSRRMAAFVLMMVLSMLTWVQIYSQQWENMPAFVYVVCAVSLPLLVLIIRTWLSDSTWRDRQNSVMAKWIMLSGILSMAVFYATF